ncbi:hypothetical protein OAD67_03555, partial [bacterium]|nr:hypothetical protein [bacterium]
LAWWGAGMADEVFDEKFENPSDELNKIANSYSKARGLTCLAGAGLAGVSTYLLYVLAVPLGGAECIYCLTSAALSFSIFAIGWSGLSPKQAASTAPAAIAIYAVVVLTSYLAIGSSAAKEALAYQHARRKKTNEQDQTDVIAELMQMGHLS